MLTTRAGRADRQFVTRNALCVKRPCLTLRSFTLCRPAIKYRMEEASPSSKMITCRSVVRRSLGCSTRCTCLAETCAYFPSRWDFHYVCESAYEVTQKGRIARTRIQDGHESILRAHHAIPLLLCLAFLPYKLQKSMLATSRRCVSPLITLY
ncbi:uncharacterized protein B0I36DRAFT_125289 [Microdochium trichocladiopsis]|uniref:Uncharacterized protein n=1 Tax=Microdochium trichocladiopsis TaxID=1682393 RepID=A0A9P8Y5L7_9PEZI|nr:uncharacterized protein B0I36DRAFT_125289 [Microdochium trichocladiopsis]KAH7031642.1 hypothetical protein B0I36DRAFT_125289 [Microdochium trichocladiopsis]